MNRKITLIDRSRLNDLTSITATHKKTDIKIYNHETHNLIFRGCNKIILPGAGFTARSHFNISNKEITPSYNTALVLENSVVETPSAAEKTYLFCVGTDGCGTENSQVYEENYAKWIDQDAIVPFRYPLAATDISDSLKSTYFGRKVTDKYVGYYFKKFETDPEFTQQFIDGTPIDSDIYTNSYSIEVESYVEINLAITPDECREFFIANTGINSARINAISLCTAWPKTVNGLLTYQDIRPLTRLNIPNEALIDLTKGIDIIYHIYY